MLRNIQHPKTPHALHPVYTQMSSLFVHHAILNFIIGQQA